ncbi:MAG: glycosyl hydrolase, partial [Promethearchaeota archaeon]
MRKNRDWRKEIKNPSAEYRSAPFWSWNDELKVKELKFQLEQMKKGGLGGGFMHSRIGLITEYLSNEWKKCILETVKYAKKLKMLAYLYDEDRWPSGFAGGLVTKKKKNRMINLLAKKEEATWRYEIIESPYTEWYNNLPYADLLSKSTVKDFIKSTYEYYKNFLKSEFGKTIPAIFTDEPNYISNMEEGTDRKTLPWTKNFDEFFMKKYGYNICSKINLLFEKKDGWMKVRYDYWRLITELFVQNFGKQIYDWCKKNNLALTGHYLEEDTLSSQIRVLGFSMALYEYMQIPGIDHLGRRLLTPVLFKQVSSIANQLGQKRILSELYGCSSQSFNFAQRKWITDWHFIFGINLLCPHLYLYSLRGVRKRDYPPTISHHQPYWKYNYHLEDYFARMSYILTNSKAVSKILMLHPIESIWSLFSPGQKDKMIKYIDDEFLRLNYLLLTSHYDYDFGSEILMEKIGKVNNSYLEIGNMKYNTVIIPPLITLRKSTIELLSKFIYDGGKVILLGKPKLVEGEKNSVVLKKFMNLTIRKKVKELIPYLNRVYEKDVLIYDKKGNEISEIMVNIREIEEEKIFFIVNLDEINSYEATIKIKGKHNIEILDALDNKFYSIDTKYIGENSIIELNFAPFQSYVIVLSKQKSKGKVFLPPVNLESFKTLNLNDGEISLTDINVI